MLRIIFKGIKFAVNTGEETQCEKMPLHVQPKSLRDLSIPKVGHLIFDAWVAVEREYGVNTSAEWSARQKTEVAMLRSFLHSRIQPLLDEVFGDMCRVHVIPNQAKGKQCYQASKDIRILIALMIHDQIKVLHFGHEFSKLLFVNVSLSDSQIGQMKNLVELDIPGFPLTDKMLEGIGRTCEHLEKINIACVPKYATLESLRNLLKCRKLEYVEISFDEWKCTQFKPYITMLITELPNLKIYNTIGCMVMDDILCELPSVTSLQELDLGAITAKDFATIIQKCPHVKHLRTATLNFFEACDSLAFLGTSSVQLETMYFDMFRFERQMIRLLEQKGSNLTKLVVDDCEGPEITLSEVCAIGVNCPKLQHLEIFESRRGKYIKDPPLCCRLTGDKRRIVKRPRMFRELTLVNLHSAGGWDVRVVLQILLNADRLKTIVMLNVFSNSSQDILSEILNANPLSELKVLSMEALHWFVEANPKSPRVSRRSIQRLLERCTKLDTLHLMLALEPDAAVYVEQLKADVKTENLDLALTYVDPTVSSDESEQSDDADDSAHDDVRT